MLVGGGVTTTYSPAYDVLYCTVVTLIVMFLFVFSGDPPFFSIKLIDHDPDTAEVPRRRLPGWWA